MYSTYPLFPGSFFFALKIAQILRPGSQISYGGEIPVPNKANRKAIETGRFDRFEKVNW